MVRHHLEARREHVFRLMVEADRGVAAKIVGQRLHAFMEQRHPMLHAGMPAAVADREVERIAGRLLPEQLAPLGAEAADAGGVEEHLVDRPQHQPVQLGAAALGGGVEAADALDGVAEQVEPHRLALSRGEDVDDAAAHRILARLHDGAGAAVAVGLQEAGEVLDLDRAVHRQRTAAVVEDVARRHLLHQRVHRGQHDARLAGGLQQAGQGGDAFADQLGIGRDAVVRQAVPGREAQHLGIGREEAQALGQPRHPDVVARHVQQRAARELLRPPRQQHRVPALGRVVDGG